MWSWDSFFEQLGPRIAPSYWIPMQVIILLTVLTESPNIFIENHQKAKQSGVMSCVMLGVMLGPNLGKDNILAKLLIGLQFHEKNIEIVLCIGVFHIA